MAKDQLNFNKMEIKKEVIEGNFGENSDLRCESTVVKEENVSEFLSLTQKLPKPTKIKIEEKKKYIAPKKFKCDECDKAFNCRRTLSRHKNTHRIFECKTCGKKFQRKHYFDKHKCLICKICNEIFNFKPHLIAHMEINHGDIRKKFECDFCDKMFAQKPGIQLHLIQTHSNILKSFKCDLCEKMFATLYLLKRHMGSHQKSTCNICDKLVATQSLKKHMHNLHGTNESFKCDQCLNVYTTINGLKKHLAIHNKEFSCKICNKLFNQKTLLADHQLLHNNPESFQCTICGKGLSYFKSLKLHMKTMHGDKKNLRYQCEKCDYATDNKQNIKSHRKAHEKYEEKLKSRSDWIKCEKCLALHTTKGNLKIHIENVHGSQIECDLCGNFLRYNKRTLEKHFIKCSQKTFHL